MQARQSTSNAAAVASAVNEEQEEVTTNYVPINKLEVEISRIAVLFMKFIEKVFF